MNWIAVANDFVTVTEADPPVEIAAAPAADVKRLVIGLSGIPDADGGNLVVWHKKGATLTRVAFGRLIEGLALPALEVVTLGAEDESLVAQLDEAGSISIRAEILENTES